MSNEYCPDCGRDEDDGCTCSMAYPLCEGCNKPSDACNCEYCDTCDSIEMNCICDKEE